MNQSVVFFWVYCKGSIFHFSLPFKEGYTPEIVPREGDLKSEKPKDLSQWSLLIAEDEDDSFELLEKVLSPSKIKIIRAKNGMEVLDFMFGQENVLPDLIFMDIKMPGMNGIDAFVEIRKNNM